MLGTGTEWADGSEEYVLSVLREAHDRSSASDELAAKIRDWPTRYHLSRLRSKIISPLRIEVGTRVLDLGGGTGPLSRKLGELGAEVLLVDGSAARAEAAAERCKDMENVSVAVGTVFDVDDAEPFDVVVAVGLLEYAQSSPGGPSGVLSKASSLLSRDGVLAVAIENAIGLKYLLGYAEDHIGLPWVGWEGYTGIDDVRTYSRRELASMLSTAGLSEQAWFYPFPDYKLPTVIVSDAGYALGDADVVDAIVPQPCAPDASLPILLADARAAHRTMLRAGLGPDIANSFLVVSGRTTEAVDVHVDRQTLAWLSGPERRARFMRDRRLVSKNDGLAIVDDSVAAAQVGKDWLIHRRLPEVPFARGEPLDRLVSEALAAGDAGRTRELLVLWAQTLKSCASPAEVDPAGEPDSTSPFQPSAGSLALPGDYLDSQPANFVHLDGRLERIDAEWQVRGIVDFDLVCIRGLFHFAVDTLARGISASRVDGRDVASVIRALAEEAGLGDSSWALRQLSNTEGALQALVQGVPFWRARTEIERILSAAADELMPRADQTPLMASVSELEAELHALRHAHEAQARHLVSERLAVAEQVEREIRALRAEIALRREEITNLREELAWRVGVMERHDEQLEVLKNSRSFRYTEPLRRLAAAARRR